MKQPMWLALLAFFGLAAVADCDELSQKPERLDVQIRVQLDYLVYLPKDYDKHENWPLMLFLHGSGERGHDIELVKTHGPAMLIEKGKEFPFIVVSPQCPTDQSWEPLELIALLDELGRKYKIASDRVYLTGISMGGVGACRLAAYAPNRFAALVPVAGAFDPYIAKRIGKLPIWVFHGAKDKPESVVRAQAMVEAIKTNGGSPEMTIYPELAHDCWTVAYNTPELYTWLLSQKRTSSTPAAKETLASNLKQNQSVSTNWPQFRGTESRGVAENGSHPDHWSATENVEWKTEIPGRGWSSPIVWGDRVFLTTVVSAEKPEEPKKGLYFGGDRPKPSDAVHQWKVLCLDLNTGKVIWEKQVHEGKPQNPIHLKSSYASETPVADGERVYCYFGNVGVFCFDFDGREIWNLRTKPHATRYGWGTAASPVLHQDRLYLVNDNEEESYLLALDSKTGKEIWQTARDEKSNWSTPFVWQNRQRAEIVTPGTGKIRSYDLDGNILWTLSGMSSITIATPYQHNGLLYLSSGYVMDSRRPIYAIRPGASGDISLKDGQTSNEFIAWSQPKAAPYNPTTLVYDNRIFVLYDRSLVSCFQASDGKELYGQQRLPNGQAFTSSPWGADGKIFCLNEEGVTFVLKSSDQFELLHTNSLASDDMCMATPAISGDRLLIRTAARIYCIRNAKP